MRLLGVDPAQISNAQQANVRRQTDNVGLHKTELAGGAYLVNGTKFFRVASDTRGHVISNSKQQRHCLRYFSLRW